MMPAPLPRPLFNLWCLYVEFTSWLREVNLWWIARKLPENQCRLMEHVKTIPIIGTAEWRYFWNDAIQQECYNQNFWDHGKPPVLPPPYVAPWCSAWSDPYFFLDKPSATGARQ